MVELWRSIPYFSGYEASTLGRIRSERLFTRWGRKGWRVLKPWLSGSRAPRLQITLTRNSKRYRKSVHRIILETFTGSCPLGMQACHNDGNPMNNHLENLRWDTRRINDQDVVRHGIHKGSRNPQSKLKEADIPKIKQMFFIEGKSKSAIARKLNVTRSTIFAVITGRTWTHVEN